MSQVAKGKDDFEGVAPAAKSHKIRITLTSRNVKNLEKVCSDLINRSKDKDLRTSLSHFISSSSFCLRSTLRSVFKRQMLTWDVRRRQA